MAKLVLVNQFVTIASTDISGYTSKAEIQIKVDDKDVTTYGSGGWDEHLGGLKGATLNIECFNDFAAGLLDSIFFPLLGTVVTFEVRPTQAARGTSNPAYTGSVLITEWNPITGKVGDVDTTTASWPIT